MKKSREFHDGRDDGLVALESLDPDAIDSFADLLRAMSRKASLKGSGPSAARSAAERGPEGSISGAKSSALASSSS